ncbi:MAG: hypothetical protein K2N34_16140 [Lachnospiraceae bacterium]|nr:hypothetical protein [Lachnospiraceae bacterium]
MKFTLEAYAMLLRKLLERGYVFKNYKNWKEAEKTVILRHDIDSSLKKAVELSQIENQIREVGATYFVLLSTNFYNVHSRESKECIRRIMKNGGSIGLHFDETQYSISDETEMRKYIYKEVEVLSDIVGAKVDVVSMHRPSREFLTANMQFTGIINSYNKVYFKEMKYLSDSRRCWRENVEEIIEQSAYRRLHILTHPFWYMERVEIDLRRTLKSAILNASLEYYDNLNKNFQNLQSEIERIEIERIVH